MGGVLEDPTKSDWNKTYTNPESGITNSLKKHWLYISIMACIILPRLI